MTDDVIAKLTQRTRDFIITRFGTGSLHDPIERAKRLIEECAEFAQAVGVEEHHVYRVVKHVYGRKVGDPKQEIAGVGLCAIAAAVAVETDLAQEISNELNRVEQEPLDAIKGRQDVKLMSGISEYA